MEDTINWSVFTLQEQTLIHKLIDAHGVDSIAGVVDLSLPLAEKDKVLAKEREMQKIKNLYTTPFENNVSPAHEEFEKWKAKGGRIESPEQEKQWQDRFDEEARQMRADNEKRLVGASVK